MTLFTIGYVALSMGILISSGYYTTAYVLLTEFCVLWFLYDYLLGHGQDERQVFTDEEKKLVVDALDYYATKVNTADSDYAFVIFTALVDDGCGPMMQLDDMPPDARRTIYRALDCLHENDNNDNDDSTLVRLISTFK